MATAPDCSLTFVGTATTVLRLGSFTVLTDPNFLHKGQRVYLGYGLSSKRLTEPAMQPEDLRLVTMDGRQGADLVELIGPPVTVPIHYDDYTVFKTQRRGLADGLRTVGRGDTISLPTRVP